MPDEPVPEDLRIGELGRRAGVSEHVLRAWERRYGLLRPARTPGGYRLYSAADEQRLGRMLAHLARGLAPAQAARAVLGEEAGRAPRGGSTGSRPRRLAGAGRALGERLDALDEPGAQAEFDLLLARYTVEAVLRDAVLPYLRRVGERWAAGTGTVGAEHFASNVLRGRLAGLAQGWGAGIGPRAVLACPPGERHDLALLIFGIVLHRHGWRVEYLGADTPVKDVAGAAATASADLVVLAAAVPGRLEAVAGGLAQLAAIVPLALAGAGATQAVAAAAGARLLTGDPVTAAETMPAPRPARRLGAVSGP